MPPGPDLDLHWTAFLYAAGELSPAEEAAFERRLADDQAAREAVAGAVGLAGTLAALGPESWPATRDRRPARRALRWSGLAAAACLAVASLWSLRAARVEPADPAEVAMAWSGLRRPEPIAEADFPPSADDSTPSADPDPSADPALPSWLLTAAGGPADPPREED